MTPIIKTTGALIVATGMMIGACWTSAQESRERNREAAYGGQPPALVDEQDMEGLEPDNAAFHYWRALALVDQMPHRERRQIDAQAPIDDEVAEVLRRHEETFVLLHRGASMEYCDWGRDERNRIDRLIPQFGLKRAVAQLWIMRARLNMQEGRHDEAVEDFLATLAFGRHVGYDPLVINRLVELAIVNTAVHEIAVSLLDLPAESQQRLAQGLDRLPDPLPMGKLLRGEQQWAIQELDDRPLPNFEEVAKRMAPFYDAAVEHADATPEVFAAALEQATDEMRQRLSRPEAELREMATRGDAEEFAAIHDDLVHLAALNLVEILRESVVRFQALAQRGQIDPDMLRAAVAVALEGPEAIADQPFDYRATETGFELLTSEYRYRGEPLRLRVGRRSAED